MKHHILQLVYCPGSREYEHIEGYAHFLAHISADVNSVEIVLCRQMNLQFFNINDTKTTNGYCARSTALIAHTPVNRILNTEDATAVTCELTIGCFIRSESNQIFLSILYSIPRAEVAYIYCPKSMLIDILCVPISIHISQLSHCKQAHPHIIPYWNYW